MRSWALLLTVATLPLLACDGGGTLGGGAGGPGGTGSGGSGGVVTCRWGNMSYPVGGVVPGSDACNTCVCTSSGNVACTDRACPPDGGEPLGPCILDATYSYGDTGGFTAWEDQATLTPPSGYSYARMSRVTDPPNASCAPPLPTCGLVNAIDGVDIMQAIGDPDVQSALSRSAGGGTPIIFGRDARPVDGTIFRFGRAAGTEFFVGGDCGTAGPAGCNAIPAGVARLVTLLRALDQQQLADASCAALR